MEVETGIFFTIFIYFVVQKIQICARISNLIVENSVQIVHNTFSQEHPKAVHNMIMGSNSKSNINEGNARYALQFPKYKVVFVD